MGIAQRLHGIVSIFFRSILFIAFFSLFVSASTLRVPEEYSTIQGAINTAVDFDTVLINDGTYTGDGNRDIDFFGKSIVVKSVNGAASTIIDCQADSTNPHRGFIFHSGEDSLSILQGLTIQNGYAPGNVDSGQANGGGILCDSNSSPTITECAITQNWARNSGGGIAILNSSPRLTKCVISYNTADSDSDFLIAGYGGAIRCYQSDSTRLLNCSLLENRANLGGGISCNNSDIVIDSCRIANNIADVLFGFDPAFAGVGGGAHFFLSNPLIVNCEIYRNEARTIFGALDDYGKGGGLAISQSNPILRNCSITYNIAEGWPSIFTGEGAGLTCVNAMVQLEHCIVAYNEQAEGIFVYPSASIAITCSNIFGNEFGDWITPFDTQLNESDNFSSNPQFCDPISNDFRLSQTSPCSPLLSSCSVRIGANDIGCVSTDIEEKPDIEIPKQFILYQNYPNPFNSQTAINFDSRTVATFELYIYNLLGEKVFFKTGKAVLGSNTITWSPEYLASGLYLYKLNLRGQNVTRKMIYLK